MAYAMPEIKPAEPAPDNAGEGNPGRYKYSQRILSGLTAESIQIHPSGQCKEFPEMNRTFRFVPLFLCMMFTMQFSLFSLGSKESSVSRDKEIIVWTYDSFNSEWGPGPQIKKRFEEETGLTLRFVSHGDAGTLLSHLLFEKDQADADVILGIDQNMMDRAIATGLLEPYKPGNAEALIPEIIIDPQFRVIPVDYSYFALIYDSEKIPNPPASLEDLTKPEYERKLILMDPRTSSPGLGFLAWTKLVYQGNWLDYWKRLAPSILTIADGWSSGYGLFTSGEAPLVLSYTTSPGYHLKYEGTERYQAAMFREGHPIQIELAALLKAAKNKPGAKRFIDFILEENFQDIIPETNWMYPVTPIPLPPSFRINPKSDISLYTEPLSEADIDAWAELMAGIKRW